MDLTVCKGDGYTPRSYAAVSFSRGRGIASRCCVTDCTAV